MPKEVRVLAAIEHRQERRVSARRGFGNAIATAFVDGRLAARSYATIVILSLQARLSKPRLAYASRSWLHDVRSLQKATFALHKRTFPRVSRVSPPWLSEPHPQVQCDEFPRLDFAC
jgi:hypothetical protein